MKTLFTSFLILVGSCATVRHSERVDNLRNSIDFKDDDVHVQKYLSTIQVEQLKDYVYEIASDKYMGRMTGEDGHDSLCKYKTTCIL